MLEQGLGTLKGQIDKQANVFQGNPSAMGKEQQKHKDSINKGITPDLLKALAMQKVASETAAAENQLKLSMEQNSATVVEQLEQNAMARTQDDLVKQTAGILNERNKKRKQQMSPSKPPQQAQQRPPMQMAKGAPQGAPQGLPAAPRPPMQMANGGIVGYNKGDKVEAKKEEMPSGFSKMFGDVVDWAKENPAEAVGLGMMFIPGIGWAGSAALKAGTMALKGANVLYKGAKSIDYGKKLAQATNAAKQAPSAAGKLAAKTVTRPSTSTKNVVDGVSKGIGREYSAGRTAATGAGIYGIGKGLGALDQKISDDVDASIAKIDDEVKAKYAKAKDKTIPDMGGAGVLAPAGQPPAGQPPAGQPPAGQPPAGPQADMAQVNKNLARVGLDVAALSATPDISGISKTQVSDALPEVKSALKKDMAKDPTKVQQDALTRMSGSDKSKGGFDIAGQEAVYNKYLKEKEDLDKELLDPERLERERVNAGIAGLIEGGTSRGASISRRKFDENTIASRQASINQRLDLEKQRMNNTTKLVTEVNKEAGLAMRGAMDERQKAMATLARISADDIAMYNAEADRVYASNQNGIKNKIDALQADTAARIDELVQRQASATEIANEIYRLESEGTKLRELFFTTMNPQLMTLRTKQAEEGLTEKEQGLLDQYEIEFQRLKEKTRIDDHIDLLSGLLMQVRNQNGFSLQRTSSNTDTSSNRLSQQGNLSQLQSLVQKYANP